MTDSVVPYLCCKGASEAIAYYVTVFGGEEVERWTAPDGRIGHAEVRIAGHSVYLADEHPEMGVLSPLTLGGRAVSMVVTVPDPDAVMASALEHGATLDRPVTDQPMGFRGGWFFDPFGHHWGVNSPSTSQTRDELQSQVENYTIT
jgi:PhnB protein